MLKGQPLNDATRRKQSTQELWQKVAEDYTNKIPVPDIAIKYINPQTNKPYSIPQIYFILRRMGLM